MTQTEEDFLACNLDVGVYYGDRKELGRFNTIATWQSLNVLEKKSKDEHSEAFAEAIKIAPKLSKDTIIIVNSCGDALKDRDILKARLGKLK